MRPVVLPPNGIRRFYRGGPAIAALRGQAPPQDRVPEDWVGSTTEAFGEPGVGLSALPDGTLLRDAIAADAEAWLGAGHVRRWGPDPVLLVKLLDAAERLPVHAHPAGPFARDRLGTRFGKTESWIVIGGEGELRLGWRDDVDDATLRGWVDAQDAAAMLAALHEVPVRPGDAVFVPAGVAHAIGQGLLIVELQEPSDMSVLVEWQGHGVSGEDEATLGMGWETALQAVERRARAPAGLAGARADGPVSRVLPREADAFFRAERIRVAAGRQAVLDPGFSVLCVLEGGGALGGNFEDLALPRGHG